MHGAASSHTMSIITLSVRTSRYHRFLLIGPAPTYMCIQLLFTMARCTFHHRTVLCIVMEVAVQDCVPCAYRISTSIPFSINESYCDRQLLKGQPEKFKRTRRCIEVNMFMIKSLLMSLDNEGSTPACGNDALHHHHVPRTSPGDIEKVRSVLLTFKLQQCPPCVISRIHLPGRCLHLHMPVAPSDFFISHYWPSVGQLSAQSAALIHLEVKTILTLLESCLDPHRSQLVFGCPRWMQLQRQDGSTVP